MAIKAALAKRAKIMKMATASIGVANGSNVYGNGNERRNERGWRHRNGGVAAKIMANGENDNGGNMFESGVAKKKAASRMKAQQHLRRINGSVMANHHNESSNRRKRNGKRQLMAKAA